MFYRLNVFPIAVPPLRDRGTDILLLANSFLERHARKHGVDEIEFSQSCEKAIESHNWPGNVRELENAVERAVILADRGKQIEAELLGLLSNIQKYFKAGSSINKWRFYRNRIYGRG